jgi:predicted ATP-binding protein involved in virulence
MEGGFMRITKLTVKNLFGIFHHEISLKMKDRITIIHGPNGMGKTIILTMVNALFNGSYLQILRIPFGELVIDFDDKSCIKVKKQQKEDSGDKNGNELILELQKNHVKQKPFTVKHRTLSRQEVNFPLGIIDEEISELDRIGPDSWVCIPTQEKLSLDEVLARYHDRLPVRYVQRRIDEPDWLKEVRKEIHIRFIETQRLLSFAKSRRTRGYEVSPQMFLAVIQYSEELANAIQAKLAEYATLSQSLDRTFPTRLVVGAGVSELTIEELRINLNQLEEKRSRLMAAGLLDMEKEIDFKELQRIDESNRNVLSVYIEDVKKKLSVFDEFSNRIDLLVKTINNRFLYKKMSISKKEGFIFKTAEGKDLLPTNLSSGEQHELVLLYELLFKVNPDSLILIDEPELSLHVVWQQQFLKDLQEISRIVGLDFLIATHSPQIIHDRWDLTVQLEGPQNEETPQSS